MLSVKTKRSKIIIIVILVLLLAGGAALYAIKKDRNSADDAATDKPKQEINYDPPTEEEKKQAEDNKARLTEDEARRKSQSQPTASNKASAIPEIGVAKVAGGFVELGSNVPGIFENNGTCTAKFTRSAYTVSRQITSVAEGRATYCPLIKVPVSEFPEKGTWQVKVTYDSGAYGGTSPERSIEVK